MKATYFVMLTLLSFAFGFFVVGEGFGAEPVEKYPYEDTRISQYCMDFVNQQTLSTMFKYDEIIKSQCQAGMLIELRNEDGSSSYLKCEVLKES